MAVIGSQSRRLARRDSGVEMRNRLRSTLTPFVALAVAGLIGGCADDEGDTATEARQDTTTTVLANPATSREEGGPPEVNPCAEGEDGQFSPPEVSGSPGDAAEPVTVTAREFSFEGVQAMDTTGEYALTFTNEGDQLHQIVIQRIDDDDSRPAEEILAEEVPSEFTTDVAFGFACPGEVAEPISVELEEPGRYMAVCFIPDGTTPQSPPEHFESYAPAHATRGMVEEFQVSDD
jgi:hypothetical protein